MHFVNMDLDCRRPIYLLNRGYETITKHARYPQGGQEEQNVEVAQGEEEVQNNKGGNEIEREESDEEDVRW